jgi:hypothetical protein
VHMTRRGIAAVLPPEDEEDDEDVEVEELEDAEEQDESAVTDGEEAVSAAAGDTSPGEDRR